MNGQFRAKTPYARVIAATDGSGLGGIAIEGALQLAARTKAELHVIHVAGDIPGLDAASRQVVELLDGHPHKFEVRHLMAGTSMTPSQMIDEYAEEVGDAIVVAGARGRSGIGVALLGSTTAELLSRPDCATIVYGQRADKPNEVSRVVACVDGSVFSELGVEEGVRWALALQVPLGIVQVVPPDLEPEVTVFDGGYVQNLSKELAGLGAPIEGEVLHSMSPAEAIVDSFGGDPTSLIVMATHGRVGLNRVVLGSVAAEVVRKARGPVAFPSRRVGARQISRLRG